MTEGTAAGDRRRPDHRPGKVGVFGTVTAVVAGSLLVAACGTDPPPGPDRAAAESAIHAAAVRQLVEFDNTFGPDHRFTEVLIVDHVETHAGDPSRQGEPGESFTDGQRSAIRAAVEHPRTGQVHQQPERLHTTRCSTAHHSRERHNHRRAGRVRRQRSNRRGGALVRRDLRSVASPTVSLKNPTVGPSPAPKGPGPSPRPARRLPPNQPVFPRNVGIRLDRVIPTSRRTLGPDW